MPVPQYDPKSDLYELFGLKPDASPDVIKSAYRKLAHQYHPDKNTGNTAAEEKFKRINAANEILGDPDKRREYDATRRAWENETARRVRENAVARDAGPARVSPARASTSPAPRPASPPVPRTVPPASAEPVESGWVTAFKVAAPIMGAWWLSRRPTFDERVGRYRGSDGQFRSSWWS